LMFALRWGIWSIKASVVACHSNNGTNVLHGAYRLLDLWVTQDGFLNLYLKFASNTKKITCYTL
jgi:hypothetical protein